MTSRYIRPAMEELAQKVETDLGDVYKNIGNFYGTPGTTPTTFLAVASSGGVLSKLGVPMNERSLFVNADAAIALADGLKTVFPESIARKAIEEASVGRYGRFDIFESNSLATHTVGAHGGTPLIMIISGPYQTVTAAPADNAAITVMTGTAGASYPQNLGFHKNAITLAMAPLDMPEDGASSARENFKGISIRSFRIEVGHERL